MLVLHRLRISFILRHTQLCSQVSTPSNLSQISKLSGLFMSIMASNRLQHCLKLLICERHKCHLTGGKFSSPRILLQSECLLILASRIYLLAERINKIWFYCRLNWCRPSNKFYRRLIRSIKTLIREGKLTSKIRLRRA